MDGHVASIALVLFFVLVGGFFAASEMALVSLRGSQVEGLSARGARGRRLAHLHSNPNRFLAAVQIGVTLAGFLSAAYGGATLAVPLTLVLEGWGVPVAIAGTVALVAVTGAISYASLVLGELVPKRLALQRPEGISLTVAPVLDRVATLARPVIWLLSVSTDLMVRLLGLDPAQGRDEVTREELREMVRGHEGLASEARWLIADVFDVAGRELHEVMVPRTEVDVLDADLPLQDVAVQVRRGPHMHYPVVRGSRDEVVGVVHVRELLLACIDGAGGDGESGSGDGEGTAGDQARVVGDLAREVPLMPGSKHLLPALSELRRRGHELAVVLDEYGGTDGIVTTRDLVDALIGDLRDERESISEAALDLHGAGLEVDGRVHLDDLRVDKGVDLPDGPYETVAGFVLAQLGRVPSVGDAVAVAGHRFEVTAMDGLRVSRLRITAEPQQEAHP